MTRAFIVTLDVRNINDTQSIPEEMYDLLDELYEVVSVKSYVPGEPVATAQGMNWGDDPTSGDINIDML